MTKIILFAISFSAANISWAQQPATAAPNGSTETVNADNVPIEEYVPKVIIEGKWGDGPGEFGSINQGPIGVGEAVYRPTSLAVDSRGNIYVLDTANNRIQKFDAGGKYLLFIPVESLKGEVIGYCVGEGKNGYCTDLEAPKPGMKYDTPIMGDLDIEGINIVIDSKDTLYYYLKRIKDGKETGEVWEFKNDKLVKKLSFSKKESLPTRFGLYSVGYNQWELGVVEAATPAKENHKNRVNIRKEKDDSVIEVEDNSGKLVSKTIIGPSAGYVKGKAKHDRYKSDVYFDKILDTGNIRVRTVEGTVDNIVAEEREYTPEGKLVRRIKSPPGYSHGLEVGESGVKIIRWVIQKSN